jgi:hypothetical protein
MFAVMSTLDPRTWRAARMALLLSIAACRRETASVRADSTGIVKTLPRDSAVVDSTPVVDSASLLVGPAIYLPAAGGAAEVVLPSVLDDSVPPPQASRLPAAVAPAQVELFAPDGAAGRMAVGAYAASQQPDVPRGCDAWPVVPLRTETGSGKRWRIALPVGVASSVPVEAIDVRATRDSSTFAAQVTAATSSLVDDPSSAFRRVPFDVRHAWHARLEGDTDVVVAVLDRRVNSEAMARAERTVAVLERAPGARTYRIRWKDVQTGSEDELVDVELLAMVRHGPRKVPTVFLSLDFGDGTRVQMLQRAARGWRLAWSSAYTGC